MKRHVSVLIFGFSVLSCAEGGTRDPATPHAEVAESKPIAEPGRKFEPEERWDLSEKVAVAKLKGTTFGEQEITEFWTRKGWHLTKKEERYMATIAQLETEGKIAKTGHWYMTPFNGVYQTSDALTIEGTNIPTGTEFWMEFCENEDEIHLGNPRFYRAPGYEEEHQGHADQQSDSRAGELRTGRERR